jgi:hypothetical protein
MIASWANSRHLPSLYTGQVMIPPLPMSNDLVELWKSNALRRVAAEQHSSAPPTLRVSLGVGFVAVAAMVGVSWHSVGVMVVPAVLVTVLFVHELPRAVVAWVLGRSSRVVLSEGGGSTTVSGVPLVGKAALGFALVGSFANLVVALIALALLRSGLLLSAASILRVLAVGHAFWGIAQLLPALPFRAGVLLSKHLPESMRFAHALASVAFLIVLGLGTVNQLKAPLPFILLALGALASLRILRKAHAEHQDQVNGLEKLAAQAELLLAEGNATLAGRLAEPGLASALSPACRARLWTCCAWAAIAKRDPFLAHRALGELPTNSLGPHLVASYLDCCNRTDEATELLEQARKRGDKSIATAKLLIELYYRLGNVKAVLELARSEAAVLSAADRSAIETALASSAQLDTPSTT